MANKRIAFTVSAKHLGILCRVLLAGPVLLYITINLGRSGVAVFWENFTGINTLYSLLLLLGIYIVHEALHVLAGLLVGARLSSFNFGFDTGTLSIDCACHDAMSIHGYQFFLLLPFLVLTPALAGLAWVTNDPLWWIMLVLSTSGCAFDLTVFLGLLGIPGQTRIIPELEGEDGNLYVKAA